LRRKPERPFDWALLNLSHQAGIPAHWDKNFLKPALPKKPEKYPEAYQHLFKTMLPLALTKVILHCRL